MPRILSEMKNTAIRRRTEAMSGCVTRRVRKGERWICRVRARPRVVVRRVSTGEANEAGRRRGSRVA